MHCEDGKSMRKRVYQGLQRERGTWRSLQTRVRSSLHERKSDIFCFRTTVEETTHTMGDRDYCSIREFNSCRKGTCTRYNILSEGKRSNNLCIYGAVATLLLCVLLYCFCGSCRCWSWCAGWPNGYCGSLNLVAVFSSSLFEYDWCLMYIFAVQLHLWPRFARHTTPSVIRACAKPRQASAHLGDAPLVLMWMFHIWILVNTRCIK